MNATNGAAAGFWGPPLAMPSDRLAVLINASTSSVSPASQGAGADVMAAAAAALAATHMVMKDLDVTFASAALATAEVLYQEAVAMRPTANITFDALLPRGQQRPVDDDGAKFGVQDFGSSSVLDDMALGAAWLGRATGVDSLLYIYTLCMLSFSLPRFRQLGGGFCMGRCVLLNSG